MVEIWHLEWGGGEIANQILLLLWNFPFGQILGKTLGIPQANLGPTSGQPQANLRPTSGQPQANIRQTSGKSQANLRQTSGQPRANCGQTSGKTSVLHYVKTHG